MLTKAHDPLGECDLTGEPLAIVPPLSEVFPPTTASRQPLLPVLGIYLEKGFSVGSVRLWHTPAVKRC